MQFVTWPARANRSFDVSGHQLSFDVESVSFGNGDVTDCGCHIKIARKLFRQGHGNIARCTIYFDIRCRRALRGTKCTTSGTDAPYHASIDSLKIDLHVSCPQIHIDISCCGEIDGDVSGA